MRCLRCEVCIVSLLTLSPSCAELLEEIPDSRGRTSRSGGWLGVALGWNDSL